MKKPVISKRVLLEAGAVVVLAVLLKVVLTLVSAQINTASTVNTANLPVYSGHVSITISHMQYQPKIIVVKPGTTITWTNRDPEAHTVTEGQNAASTRHGFDSKTLSSGASWSYVFTNAGTYSYTCAFHATMNGEVVVK